MGNFKKINIYVGAVGQAYVDKETAKNNLDSAKQNIKDWNNIIALAQSVLDNTNPISNRLTDAQSKANAVKTLLETEMNNAINDTEKYNALKKLRDELHALDYDNDFSNGGNTYTLDQIDNTLDSIVKEINDILSKSQSNQTYWESAVVEYQQAYDTAIEVFNSYIPEDQNNPLDKNDDLEAQFTERLHEIDVQLQEFDTAISKVNEISDKTNQEIKKITGTVVPSITPVTGISLTPTSLSINANGTDTITATVLPPNATNKTINWSSNDTTVATVTASAINGQTATVTWKKAGTCTITAKSASNPSVSATCEVTCQNVTVPDEPSNPEVQNNYYIGRTNKVEFTLDDLDQYVPEKPSEITLPGGDNSAWTVWIYPESWGKPVKAISNHTKEDEIGSFMYAELTLPEGYTGCYSSPMVDDTYTLEW